MKKQLSFFLTVLLLTSCANPVVVKPVAASDMQNMNCAQITADIATTQSALHDSRKEDRFKLQYVFIVPGVVAYRMNKAESAAQNRLNGLNMLAQQKKCGM